MLPGYVATAGVGLLLVSFPTGNETGVQLLNSV